MTVIIGDKRYSRCASWPDSTDKMFLFSTGIELPHPSEVERVVALCGGGKVTEGGGGTGMKAFL